MAGKDSHTGLMDTAAEIPVSFLLVGVGLAIIVSLGPHWFGASSSSVTGTKLVQIHDDLQKACRGRPQLEKHLNFGESREKSYITVCGPQSQKICLGDLEAGGSLEGCDSIEIQVKNGDRCVASGDFRYDATKSGSKAVLTCR